MLDRLATIDRQLRMQHHIWRMQRIDGDTREHKRTTLNRIDHLLDMRLQAAAEAMPPAAELTPA